MIRITISEFIRLSRGKILVDVRSPAEYAHAQIPGAISMPLFSDEERRQVGTAYKQESREKAIKIGLDFFGPKMRTMVETIEQICAASVEGNESFSDKKSSKEVFVYCWRGGMRSGAVSWLLDLYGFKVFTLSGGYKAFRNYAFEIFDQPFNFKLLGGYTGSGKTAVLRQLEIKGETVIDLERLAVHKGSAFGNIEMPPQPTQEMFENLLATELLFKSTTTIAVGQHLPVLKPIWLEDESQRIGNINLPPSFWNSMRKSPIYFLDIDFEKRLDNICKEYGGLSPVKLADATNRIHKRLGPNETKNTLAFLESGNIREAFRILLHYYDKHYLKGLHNRNDLEKLLTILPCHEVSPSNSGLLEPIYLPI